MPCSEMQCSAVVFFCCILLHLFPTKLSPLSSVWLHNEIPLLSMYTVHCKMFSKYGSGYTIHCKMYTVHCSIYTVHCTLCTVYCSLYTTINSLNTVPSKLHTAHNKQFVHCTQQTVLYYTKFYLFTLPCSSVIQFTREHTQNLGWSLTPIYRH